MHEKPRALIYRTPATMIAARLDLLHGVIAGAVYAAVQKAEYGLAVNRQPLRCAGAICTGKLPSAKNVVYFHIDNKAAPVRVPRRRGAAIRVMSRLADAAAAAPIQAAVRFQLRLQQLADVLVQLVAARGVLGTGLEEVVRIGLGRGVAQ